jgi:hypothetical protein
MSMLPRSILLHAQSPPEGGLASPKEFLCPRTKLVQHPFCNFV